ncbi:MAG: DUF302 domain-containing protein [Crocosphaera sp.]
MKKLFLTLSALSLFVLPAYATKGLRENSQNGNFRNEKTTNREGIVKVKSAYNVSETAQKFESLARGKGLKIIAKVDHAAGAKSVNQQLRPTQLIIFGNPAVGTPLMHCNQTLAIDLPQKALIWEDQQGQVWLGYNSPQYLSASHQLTDCGEQALQKLDNTLSLLTQQATQ